MCRYGSFAFAPPGLTFFRRISQCLRAGLMNAAAARLVCRESLCFKLSRNSTYEGRYTCHSLAVAVITVGLRHMQFGCHPFTRGHPQYSDGSPNIVFAFCSLRGILTEIAVMTGTYDPPARGCTLRGSS
jgi:hypothetical protein